MPTVIMLRANALPVGTGGTWLMQHHSWEIQHLDSVYA
jgi:hypothetical protein